MNDNSNKLKKMATWTVAIFATVFAVVMAVLWIPLFNAGTPAFGAIGQAFAEGWLMISDRFIIVCLEHIRDTLTTSIGKNNILIRVPVHKNTGSV